MTKKSYTWRDGAVLDEHSRRKHKILREYLVKYFLTRCRLLHQSLFRVAIVDGFAGGAVGMLMARLDHPLLSSRRCARVQIA